MKLLKAKNAKQLDICLKMLYYEKQEFEVNITENNNGKIEYAIEVKSDEKTFNELEQKYKVLM